MTNASNNICPICASSDLRSLPVQLRDSDEHHVLKCNQCSHVFLNHFDHIDDDFYAKGGITKDRPFGSEIEARLRHFDEENQERIRRIGNLVVNKAVLDFGCGAGALLERVAAKAVKAHGVELNVHFREYLLTKGHTVFSWVGDISEQYDVILAFHVLEHLKDPVGALKELKRLVKPGGVIYLEVPNINDALLGLYEIEEYGSFHFFKSHLHYFSRASIQQMLAKAGLDQAQIVGHSRFSIANHMYWLRHGKPGGHAKWSFLEDKQLTAAYNAALARLDATDSLAAHVQC